MPAEVSKLDNGLTVVTVPGMASLAAVLFVGAGSRYEAREVAGTAHFLEHLFFKGTPRRPTTLQLATEMDSLGGVFNAFTTKDHTAYFVKGAADYAERVVDILADLLTNALLPVEEIDRERGVILSEMKMYHDSPGSWASIMGTRLLYGDTPMGWNIVGFEDVIKSVTREQIAAYRSSFYAPGRMTLAFGGPIDHRRARELAEKYLGALEPRTTGTFPAAQYGGERSEEDRRDVQQASVFMSLPGPSYQDSERDLMAASLASTLLGGSMSSRLFISVRERQGLCYTVSSGLQPAADLGMMAISTGVDAGKASQAVRSIASELRLFADQGVTEDEVEKARAMYKGHYVLRREDSMALALGACTDLLHRGHVREQDEMFELVDSITAADMQEAAQRWFRPEDIRVAVVGPESVDAAQLLDAAKDAAPAAAI